LPGPPAAPSASVSTARAASVSTARVAARHGTRAREFPARTPRCCQRHRTAL